MNDTLITVFPSRFVRGVSHPTETMTFDWRQVPCSPLNRGKVVAHGETQILQEALATRWEKDSHFVPYCLFREDKQIDRIPRINKPGLAWVKEQGYSVRVRSAWADLDNPNHSLWDDELQDKALEEATKIEALREGVWYFTGRGRRIGVLWDQWVEVDRVEALLQSWLDDLESQGLTPDRTCKDWTRLFRLPWVTRADGIRQQQTVFGEDSREVPPPKVTNRPKRQPGNLGITPNIKFLESLPPEWGPRVVTLAESISDVGTEWHSLFLALAGALCQRGAALAVVPAICAAVSNATGADSRTTDRVTAAQTTCRRFALGEPIIGDDQLLVGWPSVHAALGQVFSERAPRPPTPCLPKATDAAKRAEQAIRSAPEGVSVVQAGCGVGKTRAAINVAIERAKQGRTASGRAVLGAKTGISLPTNALAKQVAQDLRSRGVAVQRLFSPISETNADGSPVCRFAESAKSLAGGYLSVPWELCEGRAQDPCPHRSTCSAANGAEGDSDALVIVGNHALMGAVVKQAGKTGLRVIDEPPPVLETITITGLDLTIFNHICYAFESEFSQIIKPVIWDTIELIQLLEPEHPALSLHEVFGGELVESIRQSKTYQAPPIQRMHVRRAREQPQFARDLGRASRVAWLFWRALRSQAKSVIRREDKNGEPTLLITGPNEQFGEVLSCEGATVLTDANPDIPVLSAACGYNLTDRLISVQARDGARIERVHLHWSQGARKHLCSNGTLNVRVFATALRAAIAWASEDPQCKALGLLTLHPFRWALEAVLGRHEAARRAGLSANAIAEACEVLGPTVREFKGEILLGHYGALRGLDNWKGVDALVTIADPWPRLGDVKNDVGYLGGKDGETRAEWLARCELEQAHGRLRAPHREVPGRALHVGRLLPSGPGWEVAQKRTLAEGRPKTEGSLHPNALGDWITKNHKGSIRAASRSLGCDHKTLRRYLSGERGIPVSLARRVQGGAETPYRESLIRPFGPTPEGDSEEPEPVDGRITNNHE